MKHCAAVTLLALAMPLAAQDKPGPVTAVDGTAIQECQAGGNSKQTYFLIGPKPKAKAPKDGFRLLVVMPGGDGGRDFNAFVQRIHVNALPDDFLVAEPVSVKWTPDQQVIWPTKLGPVPKMEFTTEEFVAAVIADVGKKHKLDARSIFTLSWSSSGPAAYAIALQDKTVVTGSFIAMSVFRPDSLPPLVKAKGRAFYLLHSPDDKVCPFRMAEEARDALTKAGAVVTFKTYAGDHGWQMPDPFGVIRGGVEWLLKPKADPPAEKKVDKKPAKK